MKRRGGIVLGLAAGMLWGLDGVLLGRAGSGILLRGALLTACLHDALAALWIFLHNCRQNKLRLYKRCFAPKGLVSVFLCALLGGAVGMTCNVLAISRTGAAIACAVTSAYPAAGALLGMLFLHERCTLRTFAGIICVALGAAVVGFAQDTDDPVRLTGILLAFGAMLCWAAEGVISTGSMAAIDPDVLLGVRELLSALLYLAAFCITPAAPVSFRGFWWIFGASVAGALSFMCWYRAMERSGAAIGMALNATYALWAIVFSLLLDHTRLSVPAALGAGIILCGTILTILSPKGNDQHETTQ